MIRSSITIMLIGFLLLILLAAGVGVFLGIGYANPEHVLLLWLSGIDRTAVLAISGVLLLVVSAFWLMLRYYVTLPLYRACEDVSALANRDAAHVFHHHERDDEFGDLARSLIASRDILMHIKHIEAAESDKLQLSAQRKEQLEQHIRDFELRVHEVAGVVTDSAQTLHVVAESLLNAVLLSQRLAEQMQASIQGSEERIAAITDDSGKIHHAITDMVMAIQRANETSTGALNQTQHASESTLELTAATQKISGVIQLIRKITEKINLLALNAGIESVRAGEAGKGFAVVAQEVKTLATQTKRATEDIVDNIMALRECTESTESLLGTASQGIDRVANENERLLVQIKSQHKLTNNIAYHMQSARNVIRDVGTNIDHIGQHIADVESAARNVTSAASQLNAQASILSQEVKHFLSAIDASGAHDDEAAAASTAKAA